MDLQLPIPTDAIKRRIVEIKFHIIITIIKADFAYNRNLDELMRSFCTIFNAKHTHIMYVIGMNERLTHQPTTQEIILATRYLEVPVRKVCKIMRMSNTTYYAKLKEYAEEDMPPLIPKFDNEQYMEMMLFIRGFQRMFRNIGVIL